MKKIIVGLCLSLLFLFVQDLWASGAAMKKRRRPKPRQVNVHHQTNITQQNMNVQSMTIEQQMAVQQRARQAADAEVKEIVDISEVWSSLETSSRAWALMIDPEAKVATVSKFMDVFRKNKIELRKSPENYAAMIDSMAQTSPEMLQRPFTQVLQLVAIIEYDFNNGQNKDAMALQVLGTPEAVEQNKKRLGLK